MSPPGVGSQPTGHLDRSTGVTGYETRGGKERNHEEFGAVPSSRSHLSFLVPLSTSPSINPLMPAPAGRPQPPGAASPAAPGIPLHTFVAAPFNAESDPRRLVSVLHNQTPLFGAR